MFMRFITRTAAVASLSLLGAVSPVLAQSSARAPAAPAPAAPQAAPRSVMLGGPGAAESAQAGKDPAAGTEEAAADGDSEANVQHLEGVTVQGKRDAFSKSDQHMKELINGLPCTGCDTKGKKLDEHRSFTERAASYVANQFVPQRPPEETEANELDRQLTQQIMNPTNNHP